MMIMEKGLGLEITELRLGLPGANKNEKKRIFSKMDGEGGRAGGTDDNNGGGKCETNKNQVVGWPPVCAYRRKSSASFSEKESRMSKMYVKVSMDGAPFLRKLDLSMHNAYFDLALSLEKLFGSFGIGEALRDGYCSCEFVPIYEDKEGDWMLVGDVPWEMFIESCKRLRIMKKSEAKGFELLQPKGFKGTSKAEK